MQSVYLLNVVVKAVITRVNKNNTTICDKHLYETLAYKDRL